jgi:hypothetical protein
VQEVVKIVVFTPVEDAAKIRQVLGDAGAGKIGGYTYCSFSVKGVGRFLPGQNTHPHIGSPGSLEAVEEERIEVLCDKELAPKVIEAVKAAHPYEEVALDVYPILSL